MLVHGRRERFRLGRRRKARTSHQTPNREFVSVDLRIASSWIRPIFSQHDFSGRKVAGWAEIRVFIDAIDSREIGYPPGLHDPSFFAHQRYNLRQACNPEKHYGFQLRYWFSARDVLSHCQAGRYRYSLRIPLLAHAANPLIR